MGEARALPDLRTAIKVDQTSLARAEAQVKLSSTNMGNSLALAGGGAKAAEKDVALMEKRMAAAGIETNKLTGLMGASGGGLSPHLLIAAGAAMVLYESGKSVLEISEKWEKSQEQLNQAVEVGGWNLQAARKQTDNFIDSNKKYIKDQSEVAAGMALIARGGIDQANSQKILNVALDLSAIKHISLTEAVQAVVAAEQGRGKALKELGISMKDYPDLTVAMTQANKNLEATHKNVSAAQLALTAAVKAHGPHSAQAVAAAATLKDAQAKLATAEAFASDKTKQQAELLNALSEKTKGGRDTTSKLEQAQNQLGNTWQHMARVVGPPLLTLITFLIQKFADFADSVMVVFDWIGKLVNKVHDLVSALGKIKIPNLSLPNLPSFGRASGGPVVPGSVYTVGENGPETLVMGQGGAGGMVIPGAGPGGGGGGPIVVHSHLYLDGKQIDEHVQTVIAGPGGQRASDRGWAARNRGLAGA